MKPEQKAVIGRGFWLVLHTGAVYLTYTEFRSIVDRIAILFPCEQCRADFQREITALPFSRYTDLNINGNSSARWSWIIHNNVSRKLRKMTISWEEFKKIFVQNNKSYGPDFYGQGWWALGHLISIYGSLEDFNTYIRLTLNYFPCEICRGHFNTIVNSIGLHKYTDRNIDANSPARGLWILHNMVNKRLKRSEMSWQDFKNLYFNYFNSNDCPSCKI